MRLCTECGTEKAEHFFGFRKDTNKYHGNCKSCRNSKSAEWVRRNLEKRRASALKYARANPEKLRAQKRKQRARDPLKMRKWSIENPEKMQACRFNWQKANRDRITAKANERRAKKYRAMVVWANEFFIREIYHLAKLRTVYTGIKWEVDHIIPMASKNVCGLHVEHNLQVIPQSVNRRKSCYSWPDMP
jgi:hypothetical protein